MERFHWLDEHDAGVWTTLWDFITWVPSHFDEHLKSTHKMAFVDYLTMLAIAQAENHRTTMSQLAGGTHMSPSRLSHVMDRLESRGLTERHRSAQDRRSTIASLTPEGVEFMVHATPDLIHTLQASIFEAVSVEEADQLKAILTKIRDHAK